MNLCQKRAKRKDGYVKSLQKFLWVSSFFSFRCYPHLHSQIFWICAWPEYHLLRNRNNFPCFFGCNIIYLYDKRMKNIFQREITFLCMYLQIFKYLNNSNNIKYENETYGVQNFFFPSGYFMDTMKNITKNFLYLILYFLVTICK